METNADLITLLSDGRFHSGEEIAASMKLSRTAVWNRIQKIRQRYSLEIQSVTGRGYRLSTAINLLDKSQIMESLKQPQAFAEIQVFQQLDSSNQFLLDRINQNADKIEVCLTEMQTAGRGRRGRQWISPYAQNLYLSISKNIAMPMYQIAGISLVAGVAVARALRNLGVADVALKWPNDLHVNESKIAGLLVEVRGEAEGPVKVVIGIGVNCHLPQALRKQIDQPVTDLDECLTSAMPDRNYLAAELLNELHDGIDIFLRDGISVILQQWQSFDVYRNQPVVIHSASQQTHGIYRGLTETGELRLETDNGIQTFNAGEVSLRKSS